MTSLSAVASFSRLRECGLDFFLWWKKEMLSLMPVGLRHRLKASQRLGRQVTITKSGFSFDGETIQPLATLGETLLSLKVGGESEDATIRLFLDETRYLERTISHRRLPLSTLKRAAELDILTETPFSMDDVNILVTARWDRQATYYIVRRDIVEEISGQLRLARLGVSGIYLGAKKIEVVSGLSPSDFSDPTRRSVAKYFDYLIGLLVLLACLFAVYQINQKTAVAAEKLDTEISEADTRAHAARSKYDQYAKKIKQLQMLRTKQAETLEVVQAWEELSRILPDTAFLTDLVVKNETMEITGFSETPAALISSMEKSPLFQRAQFASPVVKIPGFSGDHFLISFDRERG
ncbi:PilN domain-containing protein [Pararhizobium sp. LjRoot235]|uniref:PilN domain-containing protein n=1 Tax=Pararhizobium sp. LjRoot235 TaxID=3342291 RepID=UPI003ECE9250